jgi:hypothetical protein
VLNQGGDHPGSRGQGQGQGHAGIRPTMACMLWFETGAPVDQNRVQDLLVDFTQGFMRGDAAL